ncbi:MAG TPA: hopanoid-associated sugar epimerase [Chloroflexota bacterium]|nr:hopanoid-associated sugar epimerase [Chloroflexota bacterium]
MRALVTGVTGFIGSHVARALGVHGWEVRALVRPGANGHRRAEIPSGVEVAWGDVRDAGAVAKALEGCQALFHVAAAYHLWSPDPAHFYDVNVRGTRTMLEASKQAGLERVVYTSSVATVKPGGDERAFADPELVHSHYKRSKILAERVAFEYPNVVVVNPSTPIGAGDVRPTPTGKVLLDFLRGRIPAYVDTGLNLVDVEDVAEGHVLAYEKGVPGERYILGNENVTLRAMLETLAAESGRKPPRIKLPMPVAYAAGAVSELVEGRLAKRTPTVPLDGVRMAGVPMFYDSTRARRELGLPQTPIPVALRKAAAWFETHGYC